FAVVGRVGWLYDPQTLLYALGGVTFGNFVLPDSENPVGRKRSQWEVGYTVGAGGEYRISRNWSLRGEYRYLFFEVDRGQLSASNVNSVSAPSPFSDSPTSGRSHTTKFDFHLAKLGIVYRMAPDLPAGADAFAADMPVKAARLPAVYDSWAG